MNPKRRVRRSNNRAIYSLAPLACSTLHIAPRDIGHQSMRIHWNSIYERRKQNQSEKPVTARSKVSFARAKWLRFLWRAERDARSLLSFHSPGFSTGKRAPIFVYTRLHAETPDGLNSDHSLGQEQPIRTDFAFHLSQRSSWQAVRERHLLVSREKEFKEFAPDGDERRLFSMEIFVYSGKMDSRPAVDIHTYLRVDFGKTGRYFFTYFFFRTVGMKLSRK